MIRTRFLPMAVVCFVSANMAWLSISAWEPVRGGAGVQTSTAVQESTFSLAQERQVFDHAFREQLAEIADRCEENGWSEQTQLTRQWLPERDPDRQYIFLPPAVDPWKPTTGEPQKTEIWYQPFLEARVAYAEQLFPLVQQAVDADQAAQAYQLLHEILVHNPDHEKVRRILGYKLNDQQQWIQTSRGTYADQPRKKQKDRGWERGTYWKIRSAHFRIYSAADEATGLELVEHLERWHLVWRQVFFEYWASRSKLQGWLNEKNSDRSNRVIHDVFLFADVQQYRSELGQTEGIAQSSGYYNDHQEASFFYAASPPPLSTWSHELAHQLFQESSSAAKKIGDLDRHAWLVEGIAMYFESIHDRGHYVTLGGFDSERLQYAKLRLIREGFYVPLAELDALGRLPFQQHPELGSVYSQAAGLSHFLMTADQGQYRKPLIQFLRKYYRRKTKRGADALPREIGLSLAEMDEQYQSFLNVTREQWQSFRARGQTGLALGFSQLQSQDIAAIADCSSLQWLELSGNPIDDEALEQLGQLPQLRLLFLDSTHVTDKGIDTIVKWKHLLDLDLAGTKITDAGVEKLLECQSLRALWLEGTAITDRSLQALVKLKSLQHLDVRQTSLTSEQVDFFKQSRPDVEVSYP